MQYQNSFHHILQRLTIWDAFFVVIALVGGSVLTELIHRSFAASTERASAHRRIGILRWMPLLRLLVVILVVGVIVSILIIPSWENIVALVAGAGLILAFALKDYGSCLVAGLVTILERVYQPGDWIEIEGAYGEVRSIGLRAVRIVTLDDTEVIIPHAAIWASAIFNSTSGQHTVLCVTDFYLHPDHNGLLVQERLINLAMENPLRMPETPVKVIAAEQPWGTHYRLKAYAKDSRAQKLFTTDLTLRSKSIFSELGIKPALVPVSVAP